LLKGGGPRKRWRDSASLVKGRGTAPAVEGFRLPKGGPPCPPAIAAPCHSEFHESEVAAQRRIFFLSYSTNSVLSFSPILYRRGGLRPPVIARRCEYSGEAIQTASPSVRNSLMPSLPLGMLPRQSSVSPFTAFAPPHLRVWGTEDYDPEDRPYSPSFPLISIRTCPQFSLAFFIL
jgi:hypothetical protein